MQTIGCNALEHFKTSEMIFKSKMILFFACFTIFSCKEKKKETSKPAWKISLEKEKHLDSLNKDQYKLLSAKYEALIISDTISRYTFQLQDLIKENAKPISIWGRIRDITKKESSYILLITGRIDLKRYSGSIILSNEQFDKLYEQIKSDSSSKEGCFILTPTNITSSTLLTLASETNSSHAETVDDVSSTIIYDFQKVLLLINGKLIDFYLDKN